MKFLVVIFRNTYLKDNNLVDMLTFNIFKRDRRILFKFLGLFVWIERQISLLIVKPK
jgi:hypothetical protein